LKNRRSFACALQIPRALERQALAAVFYPTVAYDCGARSAVVGGRKRIAHQLHGELHACQVHLPITTNLHSRVSHSLRSPDRVGMRTNSACVPSMRLPRIQPPVVQCEYIKLAAVSALATGADAGDQHTVTRLECRDSSPPSYRRPLYLHDPECVPAHTWERHPRVYADLFRRGWCG